MLKHPLRLQEQWVKNKGLSCDNSLKSRVRVISRSSFTLCGQTIRSQFTICRSEHFVDILLILKTNAPLVSVRYKIYWRVLF